MDRRERLESLQDALRAAFDGERSNLWTALPGIIQSFDPASQTCTIKPAIKSLLTGPVTYLDDQGSIITLNPGERGWVSLPLLVDCPVYFPQGGSYSLTFPVALGDEALVVFSSRSIDAWWASGNVDIQSPLRMHDLSDGMVFVGFSSKPKVISGISTNSVQLRLNDGSDFIELAADGSINLTSWTGMIAAFGMGYIPAGWLACPTAQTLVSTTTYARLFSKLGYVWGGSGSSFGLPYFAAGYVPIAGTPGVLSHGLVINHVHTAQYQTALTGSGFPGWDGSGNTTAGASVSNPTTNAGGLNNLAAGMGVQWCVKY